MLPTRVSACKVLLGGNGRRIVGRALIPAGEQIRHLWPSPAPLCADAACDGATNMVPPRLNKFMLAARLTAAAAAVLALGTTQCKGRADEEEEDDGMTEIENWSSTHSVKTRAYLQPESIEEVERIIKESHRDGKRVRVVGSALSPNGLGLSEDTMLSLAQCDRVLHVNKRQGTVTVEAGARVQQVVDALEPHGLTLQNYASISEQQLGGFLQVGAHGTGASIPPVDEQIVAMKLVTPNLGTIELSNEHNPELFRLAKVGIGALGVVTEVTIKCVRRHQLMESTSVMTRAQIMARHRSLLQNNKHIRYMWIPYTDAVVVVRCNPLGLNDRLLRQKTQPPTHIITCQGGQGAGSDCNAKEDEGDAEFSSVKPLRDLLLERTGSSLSVEELEEINSKNFAGLRDELLALDPLNVQWIKKVNVAEAEFWRRSEGTRVDFSDKILGFECGGQQWVNEVSFPVGTLKEPNGKDLEYMAELLRLIEDEEIAAPSPIEQRWTASSQAMMSPAHDSASPSTMFCWIGIIMYLPLNDPDTRKRVTDAFLEYRDKCKAKLWDRFNCAVHWAKLEKPRTDAETIDTRRRLRQRFPVRDFNAVRELLDPKNIMANDHINMCIGNVAEAEVEVGAMGARAQ